MVLVRTFLHLLCGGSGPKPSTPCEMSSDILYRMDGLEPLPPQFEDPRWIRMNRLAYVSHVMGGGFGIFEDRYHTRVPPERLTDGVPSVGCFELAREGLLRDGASGTLQTAWGGYQIASREAGIFIGGTFVAMQSHPFNGRNFICGRCGRGCYRIYDRDGWACRRCHRLSHPSRHKNRMLTGWHRLMFLRRKISASPVPFSAIPPRPLRQRRYWRIVLEIRQIEAGLAQHARTDVADVLDRRERRRR